MRSIGVLLFLCICAAALAAGPKSARQAAPNADAAYINTLLANGDAQSIHEAVTCIGELIEAQPAMAASQARGSWLPTLIGAGYYDDAQRLAAAAMVEMAAELPTLEEFQRLRIKAFMAAGQYDRAVTAARGLFDISSMATTRAAMLQLAECLSAANPASPAVVNRLREEQLAGAGSADASSPIVLNIAVESEPWTGALLRYDSERYTIPANLYRSLMARGNMLLLSGKAKEARAAFERASVAASDDYRLQANENIARAIKAEHGCIGAANAYIRQLRH